MDFRTVIVVALLVAVGVLGYLYYESQQPGVAIKAPGVDIEVK